MGQVENALNKSGVGITKLKAPFAYINKGSGQLTLRENMLICEDGNSLKDVTYSIIDGILYIQAKTVIWFRFIWGYEINERKGLYNPPPNFLEEYEVPEECILRNKVKGLGFFGTKKYPIAIDTTKNPNGRWFKLKEEPPFNYCLHPFKIQE